MLFADASTLDLRQVRDDARLPLRLLTGGILLTIAFGTAVGLILLPGEELAFAALLAAILAPTDAALGLPIFTNPCVPVRIRRVLNVESGQNDGIATPFVTLFLAYAVAMWTILLSVVAHGLSAQPLVAWYARRLAAADSTYANGMVEAAAMERF